MNIYLINHPTFENFQNTHKKVFTSIFTSKYKIVNNNNIIFAKYRVTYMLFENVDNHKIQFFIFIF